VEPPKKTHSFDLLILLKFQTYFHRMLLFFTTINTQKTFSST